MLLLLRLLRFFQNPKNVTLPRLGMWKNVIAARDNINTPGSTENMRSLGGPCYDLDTPPIKGVNIN